MRTLLNGKGSRAAIAVTVLWLSACGAGASPSQPPHSAAEHSDGTHTESAAPTLAATFEETGPFVIKLTLTCEAAIAAGAPAGAWDRQEAAEAVTLSSRPPARRGQPFG